MEIDTKALFFLIKNIDKHLYFLFMQFLKFGSIRYARKQEHRKHVSLREFWKDNVNNVNKRRKQDGRDNFTDCAVISPQYLPFELPSQKWSRTMISAIILKY